jgi:hypothetical protein
MISVEQLQDFKWAQEDLDKLKQELCIKKAEFDEQNMELVKNIFSLQESIEAKKFDLRQDALCEYQETKNKSLTGGLGIRCMTKLIYEEEEAFDWAKEHSLCLKLDSKAFEQIAKSQDINFVEKKEELAVTFPKELKL